MNAWCELAKISFLLQFPFGSCHLQIILTFDSYLFKLFVNIKRTRKQSAVEIAMSSFFFHHEFFFFILFPHSFSNRRAAINFAQEAIAHKQKMENTLIAIRWWSNDNDDGTSGRIIRSAFVNTKVSRKNLLQEIYKRHLGLNVLQNEDGSFSLLISCAPCWFQFDASEPNDQCNLKGIQSMIWKICVNPWKQITWRIIIFDLKSAWKFSSTTAFWLIFRVASFLFFIRSFLFFFFFSPSW